LKLGEGGEKVVEVEYDEDKNEVIETFSHFMIRLEAELKMEINNPVAEQEGKGKPPMLSILYETGIITAETKMNKTGRKIGYLLKKLANVTTRIGTFGLVGVGTDEDDVVPGQKLSFAGITEGSYASEFLARDRRRFKQEA
ncbi:19368_t:CDS:2, partial [Racocetra persica]